MTEFKYRKPLEKIEPYRKGKSFDEIKKENNLENINRLNANENPYGCSPSVKEAVINCLDAPSFYPDDYCDALRSSISAKYGVSKDEMLFGNGTDEIIYFLGKAFVDQGDEVVTGEVTFFSYDASVWAMGGKMVHVPMLNHGFDLDGMLAAITPNTKMVVIVNPNNPTGTVITQDQQYEFIKKVPKDVIVVLDEAYAEFYTGDDFPDSYSMLKEFDNLIILKTFSKAYGLASFRIGFAVASEEIISIISRVKNLFNVSAQAQAAAAAAITDNDFVEMVKTENRKVTEYLYKSLEDLGISYIPTHTSFIMIDIGDNYKSVASKLLKKGYLVRTGDAFNMKGYLRMSLGRMEQMKGLMSALSEVMGS